MNKTAIIKSVTKIVRCYGQSTSPSRTTGIFACDIGESKFHNVDVFEGHVNGPIVRLLVLNCAGENWEIDKPLLSSLRQINFTSNSRKFAFQLERVSVDVKIQLKSTCCSGLHRGKAILELDHDEHVEVYEPDGVGITDIYLKTTSETTSKLNLFLKNNGECNLHLLDSLSENQPSEC